MANEIQVFNFTDQHQVRVIVQNREPWFSGKDVAKALGYTRARNAVRDHVSKNDKMALSNLPEHQNDARVNSGYGDTQIYVNEAGVYSLIFSSKLPAAEKFKDWVTHEVLPSIRKHGMYMTDKIAEMAQADPEAFETVTKKYLEAREKNRQLQKYIEDNRAYITLGRAVMALQGCMTFKESAGFLTQKGVDIGQNRLFRFGRIKGLVCSRKGRQWNKPTQKALEQGLLMLQIGEGGFHTVTMVTPKGLKYFTDEFLREQLPIEYMLFELEKDEDSELA